MPRVGHILVIDDEDNLRHMLSAMLSRQGYRIDTAADGRQGLQLASQTVYDFILCDIRMPELDGKGFLERFLAEGGATPVIMMSAYGTVDTAVECMKLGAYDFISKPFKKDEIVMVLRKAEERERLKAENSRLRQEADTSDSFCGIVSRAPAMLDVFSQIRRVAGLKTTVLILGESGTGKELVARALHGAGARCHKPFVAVNCAAIPETLLESELFGHVRGAFTDASADKAGLFEQADNGTLLLDEIGEMPLSLQVKLLRVLQEEEIRRLGSSASRKVNVRVVSATSRNLEEDVRTGRFREDLYFRLNVFTITLPPLRERIEDIPRLARHVIARHTPGGENVLPVLAPEALRSLMSYDWPGNVRELENVIERSLIMADGGVITGECLPPSIASAGAAVSGVKSDDDLSIKKAEEAIERELIARALARTGGNRTHAARILEISHRSLLYKLKEYGIE